MKKRNNGQKRTMQLRVGLLLLGSLNLTGIMVAVMLKMYQGRNAQIFNSLVEENLTSIHKGQVAEIDDSIQEVQKLVDGIAQIYESLDSSDLELNSLYRVAVEQLDILSDIEYYSADILKEELSKEDTSKQDKKVIERLLNDESVISDVFSSKQLAGAYAISVMRPVKRAGEIVGVVCGFIKADELMKITMRQDYEWTSNFLITQDGSLIIDKDIYYGGEENLFRDLEDMDISKNKIEEVRDGLQSGKTSLVTIDSPREGQFFIMTTGLQYNGWILLSMTHSNEVKGYSVSIMKNTRLLIVSLLVFLIVLLTGTAGIYVQQKERLLRNQARYELLAQFSDTILFEYDCSARSLAFTPNIVDHFDVRPEDIRYPFDEAQKFNLLHPDDVERLRNMLKSMVETGTEQMEEDVRFLNKNGDYRWMHCQAQLLLDRRGRAVMVVGKFSDVHDQKAQEQRLIQKSSTDAMTGAWNREAAEEQITEQLKQTSYGFFFMLDVDDFKRINDTQGHSAGDSLLIQLVSEMKMVFRREDIIGRLGGDEFVIFMADVKELFVACSKADALLQRLAKQKAAFTVSIGIASFPSDGRSYQELYIAADSAMYQAKREGKGKYSFRKKEPANTGEKDTFVG